MSRMLGQSHVSSITVRVDDDTPMDAAQEAITRLLTLRHGTEDFSSATAPKSAKPSSRPRAR